MFVELAMICYVMFDCALAIVGCIEILVNAWEGSVMTFGGFLVS